MKIQKHWFDGVWYNNDETDRVSAALEMVGIHRWMLTPFADRDAVYVVGEGKVVALGSKGCLLWFDSSGNYTHLEDLGPASERAERLPLWSALRSVPGPLRQVGKLPDVVADSWRGWVEGRENGEAAYQRASAEYVRKVEEETAKLSGMVLGGCRIDPEDVSGAVDEVSVPERYDWIDVKGPDGESVATVAPDLLLAAWRWVGPGALVAVAWRSGEVVLMLRQPVGGSMAWVSVSPGGMSNCVAALVLDEVHDG